MERPTAVTAFGFLNIAKGGLGMLSVVWALALFSSKNAAENPVLKVMMDNPAYLTWTKLITPIGLVTSGILLASGFGLLNLKPWARKISIWYALYAIVLVCINSAIAFKFLLHPMLEQARQLQGPEAAGMIGGAIGGTFGSVLGLVYPILLWIFMTRPKVVAAFQTPPPLPGGV